MRSSPALLRIVAPFLVACLGAAAPGAQDEAFRSGLSAFNAGDYPTALRFWTGLADEDEPRAQAGLGFMYHRGLGVPVDDGVAVGWLTRAARHGQPEAQETLGTLYFYGQGVPRSFVDAYAWCDLAASGGAANASSCRDAALAMLPTGEALKQAFALSLEFREQTVGMR